MVVRYKLNSTLGMLLPTFPIPPPWPSSLVPVPFPSQSGVPPAGGVPHVAQKSVPGVTGFPLLPEPIQEIFGGTPDSITHPPLSGSNTIRYPFSFS